MTPKHLVYIGIALMIGVNIAEADPMVRKSELGISNETGSSSGYPDKKQMPDGHVGKMPGEQPDTRGALSSSEDSIRGTGESGQTRNPNSATDREAKKIAASATDPRHDRDSDSGPYSGQDPQSGRK